MSWAPCLVESDSHQIGLGHPLVDRYLEFVAARGRRNTLLAAAYDLKVFFSVVGKDPVDVTTGGVSRIGFEWSLTRASDPWGWTRELPFGRC